MPQRETLIERDDDCRSVWVWLTGPRQRTDDPDYLADCFAAAATVIREERLVVRGVALVSTPDGVILFCDKEEGR